MEHYKQMYYTLFNAVSKAIENIESANYGIAKAELIEAQQKTEEIFISAEDRPEPQAVSK